MPNLHRIYNGRNAVTDDAAWHINSMPTSYMSYVQFIRNVLHQYCSISINSSFLSGRG